MFYFCKDITEIDLSNFDTSKVTDMKDMFVSCSSLTLLDLSNLNTSIVTNMEAMFDSCSSLTLLDLSNFNTSKVTNMKAMFNYCSSLTSLDLSNFHTSIVTSMSYMFHKCSSLSILNLSNFDTSKVTHMESMFDGCQKLEYINLKNFIENESLSVTYIFDNVPNNVIVCINENSNKIKTQIEKKSNYIIDCSDNYKGILISNSIINTIKFDIKNINCYNISLNEQLCLKCNEDYYEIENDNYTNDNYTNDYIKCYKDPKGYYLDKNIYKKCFYTCNECEKNGNNITHNCLKCNDNYSYEIKRNNYSNCYIKCNYYHYFDYNNYYCTINSSCPEKYSKLIGDECVNNTEIKNTIEYI